MKSATTFAVMAAMFSAPCAAQDAAALAKAAQNPIADMISLPFQNNTNFDVGPEKKTQNVLNIQPVYPVSLNANWNLITRTIVPRRAAGQRGALATASAAAVPVSQVN